MMPPGAAKHGDLDIKNTGNGDTINGNVGFIF